MAEKANLHAIKETNAGGETDAAPSAPTAAAGEVTLVATDRLTPYRGNARRHSKKQVEQIAASIRRFGFNNPVLVDDDGTIIVGHGRVAAAKLLGLSAVPTLRISHLSPAEKRAYVIADNRLAEKARWDRETLAIELQALVDIDFDVELTGFEPLDIAFILDPDPGETKMLNAGFDPNKCSQREAVSRPGDVWLLGNHQLVCGDGKTTDVDLILQQWQVATGEQAILASTGHAFAQVSKHRRPVEEAR